MEFAKSQDCTVYFDVHTWTHNPASSAKYTEVLISFYNALHQVCPGTDTKVIIFEYNALAHNLERAPVSYTHLDVYKRQEYTGQRAGTGDDYRASGRRRNACSRWWRP